MLLLLAACDTPATDKPADTAVGHDTAETAAPDTDTAGDTDSAADTGPDTAPDTAPDTSGDSGGPDTGPDTGADTDAPVAGGVARATLLGRVAGGSAGGAGTLAAVDLDADAARDLVVGAPGDADGWVWAVDTSVVAGVVPIPEVAWAAVAGAYAGWLSPQGGDGDGDGVSDLAVGRGRGRSPEGLYEGGVYLLDGAGLAAASSLRDARFEVAGQYSDDSLRVTTHADIDGDGFADLVTGAALDDDGAWEWGPVGSVSLFLGPIAGSAYTYGADHVLYGTWFEQGLGATLAAADVDGDGYSDVLVGAPAWETDLGAVLLIPGAATPAWDHMAIEAATLVIRGVDSGTALGADPLATPSDLDGDGVLDLAIGSSGVGSVWGWAGPVAGGETTVDSATIVARGDAGSFGTAVAYDGDLDGDGRPDLAVGDPLQGAGAVGAVWAFVDPLGGAAALGLSDAWGRWDGEAGGDAFGAAVVGLGGELAVGAPGHDGGAGEGGAVYVGIFVP